MCKDLLKSEWSDSQFLVVEVSWSMLLKWHIINVVVETVGILLLQCYHHEGSFTDAFK